MTGQIGGVIAHSNIVGGSNAGMRLACPGSYQMEQKLPPGAKDKTSVYAEEGSALHDCVAYLLDNDITDPQVALGKVFRDIEITQRLLDDAIKPSMDFFDDLCQASLDRGEGTLEFVVEQRCEFPGIPQAFGTSDIIFRNLKRSGILDWKYGGGVPVRAIYPDDVRGDLLNPQVMFYSRAAQHTMPDFFEARPDWPVELIIYQPRVRMDAYGATLTDERALAAFADGDHRVTYAMTDLKEIEDYRQGLIRAIAEAMGERPRIEKGEHCRFATCKTICPLWVGPLLDLSGLKSLSAAGKKLDAIPTHELTEPPFDWPAYYAAIADAKEVTDEFFAEALQQMHEQMTAGTLKVPGWKLVDKRPVERYIDEAGAIRHAIGLGVDPADVYAPQEIKSPAQLRDTLEPFVEGKTKKARLEKAKADIALYTAKVSSGTTLARADDSRQGTISVEQSVVAIGQKLAALHGAA